MDTLEFTPVPYWGNFEDVNSDQTWAMWKSKLILCWAVFYNLRAGPVEVLEGQVMPKPVSHVLLHNHLTVEMKPYLRYQKQGVTHLSGLSPLPEQEGLSGGIWAWGSTGPGKGPGRELQ